MSDAGQVISWADELGRIPTRNEIKAHFGYGTDRAGRARRAAEAARPTYPKGAEGRRNAERVTAPPPRGRGQVTTHNNGNSTTVESRGKRIRTLDDLLNAASIDREEWSVKSWTANAWETARAAGEGFAVETLHQVKAQLEPIVPPDVEGRLEALAAAAVNLMRSAPPRVPAPLVTPRDGYLLELAVPDLHVGKLALAEVSGQKWDLDEAERVFKSAVLDAVGKARHFPISRALFPIGNDLLHVDGPANTTTRGTPQDVSGLWHQAYTRALELMLWAIDQLRAWGVPVDVITVPGNHAATLESTLGITIAMAYRADPHVTVCTTPAPQKFYRHGTVLLGFAHGHTEKHSDLPLIMASLAPELWAKTTVREWHLGHLHQRRQTRSTVRVDQESELTEDKGVAVRLLPSLAGTDAWHASKGYVQNLRACEAHLWSADRGHEGGFTGHP